MTKWRSIDDPQEIRRYVRLSAETPSEVLAFWKEPYRSLDNLMTPMDTLWDKRDLVDTESPSHYIQREGTALLSKWS